MSVHFLGYGQINNPPKQMNVLTGTENPGKDTVIEFGCGSTPFSIDRKLSVKVDTGSDTNAINKQTIQELFLMWNWKN